MEVKWKKRKSARLATAVVSPRLVPKLCAPPKGERQLHVDGLEVLRGSRERRSVRPSAGSLALARGAGGGGRRRPRPPEAAGGPGAGSEGRWRAGNTLLYI